MAVSRLAAAAAVPVLALPAPGWRDAVQDLALDPRLRPVASPREATVLLLAGPVPDTHADAAARVHDQLPAPRATVVWSAAPPARFAGVVTATATPGDDVGAVVVGAHRAVLHDARRGERTLLPDEPPHPWRGAGDHGQGGEGMMGGYPYGRAMAMTADDRDGLALDALSLRVGPWLPGLPPGLVLDVTLQGDVVQTAEVVPDDAGADTGWADVFARLRREAVPVEEVEDARARAHLRWCAALLDLHGLPALGRRVLHVAATPRPLPPGRLRRLARRLRRVLDPATAGVGVLAGETAVTVGGPVARAAGSAIDLRAADAVYRRLGFAPVTSAGGDASARWRQRLAEAVQSADLVLRAAGSGARTGPHPVVETPRGRLGDGADASALLLDTLPSLIEGSEWGEAVTAIASLDLDPDVRRTVGTAG